jgi:transcription antitermination factor NusG
VAERLREKEIDCWLPLHRSPQVWSDRVKLVDLPLFRSYIFVHCREVLLQQLPLIYGVSHVVCYNGKPAILRPKEIEAIRSFLEQAAERPLVVGEEAEILTGAMRHVSGKVQRIHKNYLTLYIEPLHATVCVKLDEVAPANRLK